VTRPNNLSEKELGLNISVLSVTEFMLQCQYSVTNTSCAEMGQLNGCLLSISSHNSGCAGALSQLKKDQSQFSDNEIFSSSLQYVQITNKSLALQLHSEL